jgi:hypothetical protein
MRLLDYVDQKREVDAEFVRDVLENLFPIREACMRRNIRGSGAPPLPPVVTPPPPGLMRAQDLVAILDANLSRAAAEQLRDLTLPPLVDFEEILGVRFCVLAPRVAAPAQFSYSLRKSRSSKTSRR